MITESSETISQTKNEEEKSVYMQVTIDGPSASGKSTIAERVAKKLKFHHVDSGAIYRSLAYWCYSHHVDTEDLEAVKSTLSKVTYQVTVEKGEKVHKINQVDVTKLIRSPEISQYASKLATNPEVRRVATEIQREIAKNQHVVVEGRDAGTVVFPKANVKIFLTASREERAKRRLQELEKKWHGTRKDLSVKEVLAELEERDARDSNREVAPLKCAADAIGVDTTGRSVNQVVREIVGIIKQNKIRRYSRFWAWVLGKERARCSFIYKIATTLVMVTYKLFYRLKVYGLENYPKGAAIIAPNHVSFLDPPAVGSICPAEVYALGADYLFKIPVISFFLKRLNTLKVSGNVGDIESIKSVVAILKRGKQVVIFPEGARSDNGELLPLKRGVALLASIGEAKIVPTIVLGAYAAWPKAHWIPKPWGRIAIVFGKPLDWKDYEHRFPHKKEGQAELIKDLARAMRELQAEYRAKLNLR